MNYFGDAFLVNILALEFKKSVNNMFCLQVFSKNSIKRDFLKTCENKLNLM